VDALSGHLTAPAQSLFVHLIYTGKGLPLPKALPYVRNLAFHARFG